MGPNEIPEFFAGREANDPVRVDLSVTGERPWERPGAGRIDSIALRRAGGQCLILRPAEALGSVTVLLNALATVPVITRDAAYLHAWMYWAYKIRLNIIADEVLAERYQKGIADVATLPAYQLDLRAALIMAEQTVLGYHAGGEWLHPLWTSLHESGSPRLTAKQPPIQSTPVTARRAFKVSPFCRWYNIRWPNISFTALHRLTQDPYFAELAAHPKPIEVLAALWNDTTPTFAAQVFFELLNHGPNVEHLCSALALQRGVAVMLIDALTTSAPYWEPWVERSAADFKQHGVVTSFLFRPVSAKDEAHLVSAEVHACEATLLKMLLVKLSDVARQRHDSLFARFHSVIPMYSQIFYQVDAHIPVAEQAAEAKAIGESIGLLTEVWAGPTWGDLVRVDDNAFADQQLALMSPATYPERCPECQGTAADLPTVQEHLVDVHQWEPSRAAAYKGPS